MAADVEIPEWLVPGARVVVYSEGGFYAQAYLTTVKRVATKSFTVDRHDERFSIAAMSVRRGGTWGTTFRVVPANSSEGRVALAVELKKRRENKVRDHFEVWLRDKSEDNRLALMAALEVLAPDQEVSG